MGKRMVMIDLARVQRKRRGKVGKVGECLMLDVCFLCSLTRAGLEEYQTDPLLNL